MSLVSRNRLFWFPVPVVALGCTDVSWPNESIIDSLRVLAVQAEPASVQPGTTSRLSMLCADGSNRDASCNQVEVAWFADCNNPENDDPRKCLNHYGNWFQGMSQPLSDSPEVAALPFIKVGSVSETFEYKAPADILRGETTVADQRIRYGAAYVYFAACAGKLYPAPGLTDQLPVQCRDRDTGALLDQRRFVVGMTTIYAYDKVRNDNPAIDVWAFDRNWEFERDIAQPAGAASQSRKCGEPVAPCSSENPCRDGFTCATDGECVPVVAPCPGDPDKCPVHCLSIGVCPMSFALTTLDGAPVTNPLKSLWVEYYTNAGAVPDDGDARFGMRTPRYDEPSVWGGCAQWRAPAKATDDARIWVVLRDDRGGITWHTQRVFVQ